MYRTMQDMLEELIVDMRTYNAGPYACRETALALTKLEEAQMWLNSLTRTRRPQGTTQA